MYLYKTSSSSPVVVILSWLDGFYGVQEEQQIIQTRSSLIAIETRSQSQSLRHRVSDPLSAAAAVWLAVG